MSNRKLVTFEVAKRLGVTRNNLTTYLTRHPDLKPEERLPNGDYLWSEDEIEAVLERRNERKNGRKQVSK